MDVVDQTTLTAKMDVAAHEHACLEDIPDSIDVVQHMDHVTKDSPLFNKFSNPYVGQLCLYLCGLYPRCTADFIRHYMSRDFTTIIDSPGGLTADSVTLPPGIFNAMQVDLVEYPHQLMAVANAVLIVLNGRTEAVNCDLVAFFAKQGSGKTVMALLTLKLTEPVCSDWPARLQNNVLHKFISKAKSYRGTGTHAIVCQFPKQWTGLIERVFGPNVVCKIITGFDQTLTEFITTCTKVRAGVEKMAAQASAKSASKADVTPCYAPDFVLWTNQKFDRKANSARVNPCYDLTEVMMEKMFEAGIVPTSAVYDDVDTRHDELKSSRSLIASFHYVLSGTFIGKSKFGSDPVAVRSMTATQQIISMAPFMREVFNDKRLLCKGMTEQSSHSLDKVVFGPSVINPNELIKEAKLVPYTVYAAAFENPDEASRMLDLFSARLGGDSKLRNQDFVECVASGSFITAARKLGITANNSKDLLESVLNTGYNNAKLKKKYINLLNILLVLSKCQPPEPIAHTDVNMVNFKRIVNMDYTSVVQGVQVVVPLMEKIKELYNVHVVACAGVTLTGNEAVDNAAKNVYRAGAIGRLTHLINLTLQRNFSTLPPIQVRNNPKQETAINGLIAEFSAEIAEYENAFNDLRNDANSNNCSLCKAEYSETENRIMTICCKKMMCENCLCSTQKHRAHSSHFQCRAPGCSAVHRGLNTWLIVISSDANKKLGTMVGIEQECEFEQPEEPTGTPEYKPDEDGKIEYLRKLANGITDHLKPTTEKFGGIIEGSGPIVPNQGPIHIAVMANGPEACKRVAKQLGKYGHNPVVLLPEHLSESIDIIETFLAGDEKFIIVDTATYRAGVNLVVSDLVFMHAFASAISQAQSVGRAQRLGRKYSLRIHKLRWTKGEVAVE